MLRDAADKGAALMKWVFELLKKKKNLAVMALVSVMLIAIVLCMGRMPASEAEATPGPEEAKMVSNETDKPINAQAGTKEDQLPEAGVASNAYMKFIHPVEELDNHIYEQEINGAKISEKYYAMIGGEKKLLYGINFGEEDGNWLGLLATDSGDVYITYNVYAVSEDEMAAMNDTERLRYYELMDGLGTTLSSITADSRFREEKPAPEGMNSAELACWTVSLPDGMTWTETNEDGEYQAIFYGMVQGEQIPLYMVRIGDIEAQSVLGKYLIDGVEKTLSVESFGLPQHDAWTDEEYIAAGEMMETINDVIQVIDASEQFTPQ